MLLVSYDINILLLLKKISILFLETLDATRCSKF
jgi:hypothetical protein